MYGNHENALADSGITFAGAFFETLARLAD
jgi:hypothetical protein